MDNLFYIFVIGYLIRFTAFLAAAVFCLKASNFNNKTYGNMLGLSAGILISFVCFEMLPIAFENDGVYVSIIGILAGVIVSVYLEMRLLSYKIPKYNISYIKMSIMLCMGVLVHSIPEGMSVGALINQNVTYGIYMAVIIMIHCFPESMSIILPLKKSGTSNLRIILLSFVMGLPMGLGALIGGVLSSLNTVFISFSLSFAGGIMIYIVCGQIIPESKVFWGGISSTVLAVLGFILGIILTVNL